MTPLRLIYVEFWAKSLKLDHINRKGNKKGRYSGEQTEELK